MKIKVVGYRIVEEVYEVDDDYAILANDEWVDEHGNEYYELANALVSKCDELAGDPFEGIVSISTLDDKIMVEDY